MTAAAPQHPPSTSTSSHTPRFFNCDVNACRRRAPVTDGRRFGRGRNPDMMFGAVGGIPVINFFSSSFSPSRHTDESRGTGLRSLLGPEAGGGRRIGAGEGRGVSDGCSVTGPERKNGGVGGGVDGREEHPADLLHPGIHLRPSPQCSNPPSSPLLGFPDWGSETLSHKRWSGWPANQAARPAGRQPQYRPLDSGCCCWT